MTQRGTVKHWFSPSMIGLHVFAVVAIIFCIVMGLWQAGVYDNRRHDEQADQHAVPRVAMSDIWRPGASFTPTLNRRPVTVEGTFAPTSDQLWITGKDLRGRTGAWLVAPLVVDGGTDALLVVRGWSEQTGAFPQVPAGPVTLDAVLEPGESNAGVYDAANRSIGSIRIPVLINELPYDLYSGFAISEDATASGGLALVPPPQPGDVSWTVGLRNLAYALQWWVFGLFAGFMWWRMTTETIAASREKVA